MKKSLLILIILLSIPCIFAQSHIQENHEIIENKALVTINIDQVSNLEIKLPYGFEALEVNTAYSISQDKLIIRSGQNIEISYITDASIDKAGYKYYFTLDRQFDQPSDVTIYLPEAAILLEDEIVFPKDYEIDSDGRRVILTWQDLDEGEILVAYGFVEDDDWHYIFIIAVLAVIIGAIYYYDKKKLKKAVKQVKQKSKKKQSKEEIEEEITKNLFHEEKEIVHFLLTKKGHEAWTKEIIKETGISKVKLSRKLRSLEAKEVIKKIPYGNENKVRLIS